MWKFFPREYTFLYNLQLHANYQKTSSMFAITKARSEKMCLMFRSVKTIINCLIYPWDGGKYAIEAFHAI